MFPVSDILLCELRNLSRKSVDLPREEWRKNLQRNEKPRNEEGRLPILWFFLTRNIQKLSLGHRESKQTFTLSGNRAVTPSHLLQGSSAFHDEYRLGTEFYVLNTAKYEVNTGNIYGLCCWYSESQWERIENIPAPCQLISLFSLPSYSCEHVEVKENFGRELEETQM